MQPESINCPENSAKSLFFTFIPTLFMKKFATAALLLLFLSLNAFSKSATVHITIKNFRGEVDVYNPELRYDLTKKKVSGVQLDAHHSASYTLDLDQPTYFVLYFSSDKFFNYALFLSPGDALFLTVDFAKKTNNITVTGRGSNNNQPEIFALTNMDTQAFKGDKTPDRVIAAINKQYLVNKEILAKYIKQYKPSIEFIKTASANLAYFVTVNYYEFSHNNNFFTPKEALIKWDKIQDSLFSTIKLSNNDALTAYNYTQLIDNFLIRETETLGREYRTNPILFYKQWFHCDTSRGNALVKSSPMSIFTQKVIDKYFTGQAAEYAYGQALKFEFAEADYPSTLLLLNQLKNKYPASAYTKAFSAPIAAVVKKQQQALNSKTVFVSANGTNLNTLKDVLALNKGKTVFIDMWGTWCGPCREEIEQHAAQLSGHFKGKDVVFLYIANYDTRKVEEWKKQIAYFQIEGTHILANPKLTGDIMGKVKSTGYPTYIIVKKDGSFKQTATRYPVNVQAMIKEIEAARS